MAALSAVLAWLGRSGLPVWASVTIVLVSLLFWRGPAVLDALGRLLDALGRLVEPLTRFLDGCARRRERRTAIYGEDSDAREAARRMLPGWDEPGRPPGDGPGDAPQDRA